MEEAEKMFAWPLTLSISDRSHSKSSSAWAELGNTYTAFFTETLNRGTMGAVSGVMANRPPGDTSNRTMILWTFGSMSAS